MISNGRLKSTLLLVAPDGQYSFWLMRKCTTQSLRPRSLHPMFKVSIGFHHEGIDKAGRRAEQDGRKGEERGREHMLPVEGAVAR